MTIYKSVYNRKPSLSIVDQEYKNSCIDNTTRVPSSICVCVRCW